ncbi:hypothetical protein P9112_001806 [Eukaryota sp. TZLM1-RC]
MKLLAQGAEARVHLCDFHGRQCVVKHRFPKSYRHPTLDTTLRDKRTSAEVKALTRARDFGILVPSIFVVDTVQCKIFMEYIDGTPLRVVLNHLLTQNDTESQKLIQKCCKSFGKIVSILHFSGLVHGDLTTSNALVKDCFPDHNSSLNVDNIVLIDFGLAQHSSSCEERAVDLGVLEKAFVSAHPNAELLMEYFLEGYREGDQGMVKTVMSRLEAVRKRGRKR